jgi:hypothetical protein
MVLPSLPKVQHPPGSRWIPGNVPPMPTWLTLRSSLTTSSSSRAPSICTKHRSSLSSTSGSHSRSCGCHLGMSWPGRSSSHTSRNTKVGLLQNAQEPSPSRRSCAPAQLACPLAGSLAVPGLAHTRPQMCPLAVATAVPRACACACPPSGLLASAAHAAASSSSSSPLPSRGHAHA